MTTTLDTNARTAVRRGGTVRRACLLGFAAVVAALGLAACQPQEPVTGVYAVNVNGSVGEITVRQSGAGDAAVFTATVSSSFQLSGFTCSLTPGTVLASFSGTSPNYTEQYARFDPSTCAKSDDGYTLGAVATVNDDSSFTLGLATTGSYAQSALLTKTGNGSQVVTLATAGDYAVNVNGSIGALSVHQSGSDAAAVFTATVTSSFKPTGFTCSLTPGTVVAWFAGAGPSFTEQYARFDPTTCVKLDDGYTLGAVARLNLDNSITLGLASPGSYARSVLLTRTGDGSSVATPVAAGAYSVNVNGSVGALTVHQSGAGSAATYTVSVSSSFKPTGFTCSLTSDTVVAWFAGAGPSFTEQYARFDPTTCVKLDDGYTLGAVARLNTDNTITLGLASPGSYARSVLLTRTGDGSSVATPVAAGAYSVNVNGSVGALTVHQSGTGSAATYTVSVSTSFKPTGFTCSLTAGTVVASFAGAGPSFTEQYARFDPTTCAKIGDGYTLGAVALLSSDNTMTLGLASPGSYARSVLLTGHH